MISLFSQTYPILTTSCRPTNRKKRGLVLMTSTVRLLFWINNANTQIQRHNQERDVQNSIFTSKTSFMIHDHSVIRRAEPPSFRSCCRGYVKQAKRPLCQLRENVGSLNIHKPYSRCKQAYLQEKHNIKRHLEKGVERLVLY